MQNMVNRLHFIPIWPSYLQLHKVYLFFGLYFLVQLYLFYVMIVLGFLETIEEIIMIFMYDEWVSDIKGIYWALKDNRIQINKEKADRY